MTAAIKDHTPFQGDTFHYLFSWNTQDPVTKVLTPVNLTGYTARMQVRPTVDSAVILLELTTENNCIALGGVNGTVELTVDASVMAGIAPGSYKYDLEMVSGGDVRKLMKGKFKVVPEVTR